jgi:hypothetical protein
MGFKSAVVTARFVAAGLMVAGCVAGAGVAGADPGPTPAPGPGPSRGAAPGPAPSAAPGPSRGLTPGPAPSAAPAPGAGPKTTIDHDGTYLVGKDIMPGTYSSAGPVGNGTCYWKRTGTPDGNLVDNAMSKKPQVVQIEASDKAFKTSGCQPWQNTVGAPAGEVPAPVADARLQAALGILNGLLAPNGQHGQ